MFNRLNAASVAWNRISLEVAVAYRKLDEVPPQEHPNVGRVVTVAVGVLVASGVSAHAFVTSSPADEERQYQELIDHLNLDGPLPTLRGQLPGIRNWPTSNVEVACQATAGFAKGAFGALIAPVATPIVVVSVGAYGAFNVVRHPINATRSCYRIVVDPIGSSQRAIEGVGEVAAALFRRFDARPIEFIAELVTAHATGRLLGARFKGLTPPPPSDVVSLGEDSSLTIFVKKFFSKFRKYPRIIAEYKEVIRKYPGTDIAKNAYKNLLNIHSELLESATNCPDRYIGEAIKLVGEELDRHLHKLDEFHWRPIMDLSRKQRRGLNQYCTGLSLCGDRLAEIIGEFSSHISEIQVVLKPAPADVEVVDAMAKKAFASLGISFALLRELPPERPTGRPVVNRIERPLFVEPIEPVVERAVEPIVEELEKSIAKARRHITTLESKFSKKGGKRARSRAQSAREQRDHYIKEVLKPREAALEVLRRNNRQ